MAVIFTPQTWMNKLNMCFLKEWQEKLFETVIQFHEAKYW